MSAPVSKKLKFKGGEYKVKKKKRSHKSIDNDDGLGDIESGSPTDWIFPSSILEVTGPTFIILPTKPPTCLAWDPTRQRVYASQITLPVAPEGAEELTPNEILEVVEPTDMNQVWVISRLSGSEDIISLRSSSGTFLTAAPSGALSATTPSRGPLESFTPSLSDGSSGRPSFTLQTNSSKYLSVYAPDVKPTEGSTTTKYDLRGDAEVLGDMENLRVKCQREFVLKARIEAMGGLKGKKRTADGAGYVENEGTLTDEQERNKKYQAWGSGVSVVSHDDRREIKKARQEGRINEAMLDRRAKLKHDKFC